MPISDPIPDPDAPTHRPLPLHRRVIWRITWTLVTYTLMLFVRPRVRGQEHIPATGGALIVANHTTAIDFLMPIWGAIRPVFAIGTDQVFRMPVAGWLLRLHNGEAVAQGVKDRAAVMHLVNAYKAGQLISMFPEGNRSWTGRPLPMTPGSGRLVKSLGCPVIYCRITTGFLQLPRWAAWPRWVPWLMSYDPPVSYPADATVEEINADMTRRLHIDPDQIEAPPGSWGFRLAEGLPVFLWACFDCYSVAALEVAPEDRNHLRCRSCAARWAVDVSARLIRQPGPNDLRPAHPPLAVAAARERLTAHFGRGTDPARWEREGVALETPEGSLSRMGGGGAPPEPLMSGRLRMLADRVEIVSATGEERDIPYADLLAAIFGFRDRIVLRTTSDTLLLTPGADSPHMWHHFLAVQFKAGGFSVRT